MNICTSTASKTTTTTTTEKGALYKTGFTFLALKIILWGLFGLFLTGVHGLSAVCSFYRYKVYVQLTFKRLRNCCNTLNTGLPNKLNRFVFIFEGVFGASNQSFEHRIRAHLLENYDKTVRPVLGNKSVEVSFAMRISRLVRVVSGEN